VEERKPSVLLIGEDPQSCSDLARRLEERGCECQFAPSYEDAIGLLSREEFDLVLTRMRLCGQSLYPLIHRLEGTRTSLFYSLPVEDGCWWLPALRHGQDYFGCAALRPAEFAEQFDQLVDELRFEATTVLKEVQGSQVPLPGQLTSSLPAVRKEPRSAKGARNPALLVRKTAS
jgi:hypothetical protein